MPFASHVFAVFGSGPGIGIATARAFAKSQRFAKIALVSRDPERLEKEVTAVKEASGNNVEVTSFPADLSNISQLRRTLAEIEKLGPLGGVFYNAARIHLTDILTTSVEELEEDFRTTNSGLYVTAQWAIPLLQASNFEKPAFLVTNTFLVEKPLPFLLSLGAVKASQQTLMSTLNDAFGQEIHFGLVKVLGVVSPNAKGCNPSNIAKTIVDLAEQDKDQWEFVANVPA